MTLRARGLSIIRLVSPGKLGQVVEEQQDLAYAKFEDGYRFNFVRLVNGIPFLRDGIRIEISNSGEITATTVTGMQCSFLPLQD